MPQIILKEGTAHLASCTFFIRDVDKYKNTSFSQLYQPPRTPFSQKTYHQLLSPCEYCKVFKNGFFIEHLQKQSFADVLQRESSTQYVRTKIAKVRPPSPPCTQSYAVGLTLLYAHVLYIHPYPTLNKFLFGFKFLSLTISRLFLFLLVSEVKFH